MPDTMVAPTAGLSWVVHPERRSRSGTTELPRGHRSRLAAGVSYSQYLLSNLPQANCCRSLIVVKVASYSVADLVL